MNNPFVHRAGRGASPRRLDVGRRPTPTRGSDQLYRRLFGRRPSRASWPLGVEFARRQAGPPVAGSTREADRAEPPLSAWEEYAQVLLLTNEFVRRLCD